MEPLRDSDLLRYLLSQADYDTIINYCRTYVQAQSICKSNVFWIHKAQQDFGTSADEFRNTILSPAQRYLKLLTQNGGVAYGAENFIRLDEFVRRAIQQDRSDLVQYAIDLGFDIWSILLYEYAKKGNKKMVDHYLKLTEDYNPAAQGALEGNHEQLFDYIRSEAPENYDWYWDHLGVAVIQSGNENLFYYIWNLVPEDYNRWGFFELAREAIEMGNQKLFDFIWMNAPEGYNWHLSYLVAPALENENKKLFDHVRSLNPGYDWDYDLLAGAAIEFNHKELFDYVRSLAPRNYPWYYNGFAEQAANDGNKQLFDYIRSLAPEDYDWDFQNLAEITLRSGHKEFFQYIESLAPSNYPWNIDVFANSIIISGNLRLLNWLINEKYPEYPWNYNSMIVIALATEDKEMLDYITKMNL
jgi:hypothetical protein